MNLLALFRPTIIERIVYVPSRRKEAYHRYNEKRTELHVRLINETIEDEDARAEMQAAVLGRKLEDTVGKALGV